VTPPQHQRALSAAGPGSDLRRLRELVADLDAVVWEFDAGSAAFTFVSEGAAEILGHPPEAFVDEPSFWADHVHPEDREEAVKAFRSGIESGLPHDIEYRFLKPDDEVVWVRDIGHAVTDDDGHTVALRGLMVDVTLRTLAEERALSVEREQAESLRALDDVKNTFLQAVSHDLRTPLAAILGLAITLERQEELDPAQARVLAGRIATNASKLDRMVTDLLDLDRLSRGIVEPKLARTDLGDLVRRVIEDSDVGSTRRVEVEIHQIEATVDGAKVERILDNLLTNAARHTPIGSRIWVRLTPEARGALLCVEDDGPGVPPGERASVFEPFRQGSDTPELTPGVGIGLTLVARFAEMHGGRAWVQEREGGGASFRVWFPLNGPEAPAAGPED
jgi:hypothetical protein